MAGSQGFVADASGDHTSLDAPLHLTAHIIMCSALSRVQIDNVVPDFSLTDHSQLVRFFC